VIATALGVPAQGANPAALWPAEPFERGLPSFSGEIAIKSARVALTPKLSVRDFRGTLHFGEGHIALEGLDGNLAGGRLSGDLIFLRQGEGLVARSRARLVGANAAELLPGDGALAGRLTADLSSEGTGMSPFALIGSLGGSGSFMIENARLARLDPVAFDAVIRAVDQGLPIDAVRVRDKMESALAGALSVPLAEGTITIGAGQARLNNTMVRAQSADLAVAGSVDLADASVDARLTLFGAGGPAAPANTRPEVMVSLKGPIDNPKRSIEVAALASWLALRAVEQQSKKLDVLEGRETPTVVTPNSASPNVAAPSVVPLISVPATVAPPQAEGAAFAPPSQGAAPSDGATVKPTRPAAAVPAPKPKPTGAEQLQPLPPPIEIRPAPRPPRPGTTQGATRPPPPKPLTAPAPRSLSEILFGN